MRMLIVWAYPAGEEVDARGRRSSLYVIEHAVRWALELGADFRLGDEELLRKERLGMEAGATDHIVGRTIWQRSFDDALTMGWQLAEGRRRLGR